MEMTNSSVVQYDGPPVDLAVHTRDDKVRLCATVLFLSALVLALTDRLSCANDGWTGRNGCDDAKDHVTRIIDRRIGGLGGEKREQLARLSYGWKLPRLRKFEIARVGEST